MQQRRGNENNDDSRSLRSFSIVVVFEICCLVGRLPEEEMCQRTTKPNQRVSAVGPRDLANEPCALALLALGRLYRRGSVVKSRTISFLPSSESAREWREVACGVAYSVYWCVSQRRQPVAQIGGGGGERGGEMERRPPCVVAVKLVVVVMDVLFLCRHRARGVGVLLQDDHAFEEARQRNI